MVKLNGILMKLKGKKEKDFAFTKDFPEDFRKTVNLFFFLILWLFKNLIDLQRKMKHLHNIIIFP